MVQKRVGRQCQAIPVPRAKTWGRTHSLRNMMSLLLTSTMADSRTAPQHSSNHKPPFCMARCRFYGRKKIQVVWKRAYPHSVSAEAINRQVGITPIREGFPSEESTKVNRVIPPPTDPVTTRLPALLGGRGTWKLYIWAILLPIP